jgi:hypothetical protein
MALVAERADDPDTALRADREYQKLLADFRRSLPVPTAIASATRTLAEAMADPVATVGHRRSRCASDAARCSQQLRRPSPTSPTALASRIWSRLPEETQP